MAPATGRASEKAADESDIVLPEDAGESLTTGGLDVAGEAAGVEGEGAEVVALVRWIVGPAGVGVPDVDAADDVPELAPDADEASTGATGREADPSVGASIGAGAGAGSGAVPRETVAVGSAPSSPEARRETVGIALEGAPDGVLGVASGIATGEVGEASATVGVPVPPSPPKGPGVTAPSVGACSSAIRLTVGPTGNDLGEAGAAIFWVTAGGSGAGGRSVADDNSGGPRPPRRRGVAVAAGDSTRGIAGMSAERWTMGAPTGVAPDPVAVTASGTDPRVGDSAGTSAIGDASGAGSGV